MDLAVAEIGDEITLLDALPLLVPSLACSPLPTHADPDFTVVE